MQEWTGEASLGDALTRILQQLPRVRWLVTTLGAQGTSPFPQRQPFLFLSLVLPCVLYGLAFPNFLPFTCVVPLPTKDG